MGPCIVEIGRIVIRYVQYQFEVNRCRNEVSERSQIKIDLNNITLLRIAHEDKRQQINAVVVMITIEKYSTRPCALQDSVVSLPFVLASKHLDPCTYMRKQ